jgi:hypothetical protein
MWAKDSQAVYCGLRGEWSPEVAGTVAKVGHNYQEAALALVAKAYSTVRLSDLATYLGQTEGEARARAEGLGWAVAPDTGVVSPRHNLPGRGTVPPTEEQLNRLTDFIAFLEN